MAEGGGTEPVETGNVDVNYESSLARLDRVLVRKSVLGIPSTPQALEHPTLTSFPTSTPVYALTLQTVLDHPLSPARLLLNNQPPRLATSSRTRTRCATSTMAAVSLAGLRNSPASVLLLHHLLPGLARIDDPLLSSAPAAPSPFAADVSTFLFRAKKKLLFPVPRSPADK